MIMRLIKQSENAPLLVSHHVLLLWVTNESIVMFVVFGALWVSISEVAIIHFSIFLGVLPTDKESVAAREQLEKDLHSTRIQLQEWDRGDGASGESTSDSHTERINSETEVSTLNH